MKEKKTNSTKGVLTNEYSAERMSPYGKFHFKYLGFNFKDKQTGKIYRKGEFWDSFRATAMSTLGFNDPDRANPTAPAGFLLVEFEPIIPEKQWDDLINSKLRK